MFKDYCLVLRILEKLRKTSSNVRSFSLMMLPSEASIIIASDFIFRSCCFLVMFFVRCFSGMCKPIMSASLYIFSPLTTHSSLNSLSNSRFGTISLTRIFDVPNPFNIFNTPVPIRPTPIIPTVTSSSLYPLSFYRVA